jgi:hypothetical protein
MEQSPRWLFRTSNSRLTGTALVAEIVPSLCLWILSPTDSVRTWYPSLWSYLGEHFLPWSGILLATMMLARPFQGRVWIPRSASSPASVSLIRMRDYSLFIGILILTSAAASLFVAAWTWSRTDSFSTTMIDSHSLRDCLVVRGVFSMVVLGLLSISLNRPVRDQSVK